MMIPVCKHQPGLPTSGMVSIHKTRHHNMCTLFLWHLSKQNLQRVMWAPTTIMEPCIDPSQVTIVKDHTWPVTGHWGLQEGRRFGSRLETQQKSRLSVQGPWSCGHLQWAKTSWWDAFFMLSEGNWTGLHTVVDIKEDMVMVRMMLNIMDKWLKYMIWQQVQTTGSDLTMRWCRELSSPIWLWGKPAPRWRLQEQGAAVWQAPGKQEYEAYTGHAWTKLRILVLKGRAVTFWPASNQLQVASQAGLSYMIFYINSTHGKEALQMTNKIIKYAEHPLQGQCCHVLLELEMLVCSAPTQWQEQEQPG